MIKLYTSPNKYRYKHVRCPKNNCDVCCCWDCWGCNYHKGRYKRDKKGTYIICNYLESEGCDGS